MKIESGTPVSFLDSFGVPWWGMAVSPVLTDDQPWPVVMVQVPGRTRHCRVPARDIQLARVTSTSVNLDWAA